MYKGNLGVLAVDNQIEELQDYFNQRRPEDFLKFEQITFSTAKKMITEVQIATLTATMESEREESNIELSENATAGQVEESTDIKEKKRQGRPRKG